MEVNNTVLAPSGSNTATGTGLTKELAGGVTPKEKRYIQLWLENDGDFKKAAKQMWPTWKSTSAETEARSFLARPNVRNYLEKALKGTFDNKEWVKTNFIRLATKAKSEDVQVRATKELGLIGGYYPDRNITANVNNISISLAAPTVKQAESDTIDAKAEEI